MNVFVHLDSSAIRMSSVKNVKASNVNVKHRTNSLEETVFWPVAKMEENVRQEPNVFPLLAVLAIVPVQRDIEHSPMDHAWTSMSAWKINISAVSDLNVSIDQEAMNVSVHLATMAMHIMANAQHHKEDALPIRNAEQTKSVFNQVNVSARHHSSWIRAMVTNVRIHAKDTFVELTQNAHHPIHHNVCARLDSKAIHYKDVSMKMNVLLMAIHAPTVHNVSIKKVATNAFVQMEWEAIHTKAVAL